MSNDTPSPARLTLVTSISPAAPGKTHRLEKDGTLNTDKGIGAIVKGKIECVEVASPQELADLMNGLNAANSLVYGVPVNPSAHTIITKAAAANGDVEPGVITRTNKDFTWPISSGVLMIDYDPGEEKPMTRDELVDTVREVCPGLSEVAMVWAPSSSSNIRNTETGKVLKPLSGQRLYILVDCASSIPRCGGVLFERGWLSGKGRIELSSDGRMLERCFLDASVWKPAGLDFCRAVTCVPPVGRFDDAAVVIPGKEGFANPDDFKALTNKEKADLMNVRDDLRKGMSDRAEGVRRDFVRKRHEELVRKITPDDSTYEILDHAMKSGVLTTGFVIKLDDGEEVTVGEILDNRKRYDGRLTLDPFERDYQGGKVVGRLYVSDASPCLVSQAHGMKSYRLSRHRTTVEIGAETYKNTDDLLRVLEQEEDVYFHNGGLSYVADGELIGLTRDSIHSDMGRFVTFVREAGGKKNRYMTPTDMTDRMSSAILDRSRGRPGFRKVEGVTDAPTISVAGDVYQEPGYYKADNLLFLRKAGLEYPEIPSVPTDEELREAMRTLWFPFKDYLFQEEEDEKELSRGAFLSALFTAVAAPCLDRSPGFLVSAASPGAGKTLLASCISHLRDGVEPAPLAAPKEPAEWGKALMSTLMQGKSVVFFDNVDGTLQSDVLAGMMTGSSYSGRVLGTMSHVEVSTRCLWLVTGNGVTLGVDMTRRFLKITIDPKKGQKELARRVFDIDPLQWCRDHRPEMVSAALTLLRGAFSHDMGMKYADTSVAGGVASYEAWNKVVRRGVLFCNDFFGGFGDPAEVIDKAHDEISAEAGGEGDIVRGLFQTYGENTRVTTREIYTAAMASSLEGEFGANGKNPDQVRCDIGEALDASCDGWRKSPISLGKFLGKRKDKVFDNLQLKKGVEASTNKLVFWVCVV